MFLKTIFIFILTDKHLNKMIENKNTVIKIKNKQKIFLNY
jgi:hypothetical protein